MAAPLEATSEGGEGANANSVDYVELLRVSLRQQKLMYIADIVMEVEEESLTDLMEYSRSDLGELLADIHNNNDNNHKIKVSHRNKFAKAVFQVATQKKEALEKAAVAPSASSTSSQVKLLFLGKEEEEAIESIQTGKKFMDENVDKMKELFNKLDENNKNVKQDLSAICKSLKQQIDEKEKQMVSNIDTIYQYHLNALNQRNEITQQSAKLVTKFYNDYESYFTDNKLTKSDRKDKLVAAKDSIAVQVDKIKKQKDIAYNMGVALNKKSVAQFFDTFLNMKDIGIDLPAVSAPEVDGFVIKWKPPELKDDISAMFKKQDDDNKEESALLINYRILYYDEDHQDEEKKDDDAVNQISNLGKENQFNMTDYTPCKAAIQYLINDIFQSPISQYVTIKQQQYIARWSPQHKGDRITLSEDNTKALMAENSKQCVRAEYPITKGMIVKLNYEYGGVYLILDIIGVISSEFVGFEKAQAPYRSAEVRKYAYGADGYYDGDYRNKHYYGEYKDFGWTLGEKTNTTGITIQMIVDYQTYDTCCLSFYIDGEFKGPQNATYSMKLPKLQNNHVWYPMTSFWNNAKWCKISCVD